MFCYMEHIVNLVISQNNPVRLMEWNSSLHQSWELTKGRLSYFSFQSTCACIAQSRRTRLWAGGKEHDFVKVKSMNYGI